MRGPWEMVWCLAKDQNLMSCWILTITGHVISRPTHNFLQRVFIIRSVCSSVFFCEPAREVVSHPTWWIRSLLARTVVPLGNPRPLLLRPYYSDWDTRLPHPLLVVKTWTPRFSQFARKATRMCTLPRPGPARSGMHI